MKGTTDCIEMLEVAITHMRRVNELLAAIRGSDTKGG